MPPLPGTTTPCSRWLFNTFILSQRWDPLNRQKSIEDYRRIQQHSNIFNSIPTHLHTGYGKARLNGPHFLEVSRGDVLHEEFIYPHLGDTVG